LNNLKSISAHILILYLIFFTLTNVFAQSLAPAGAKLETLRTGFLQPEGPVWVDSLGILFSDIKGNKIYRWSPVDSALTTYLYPSDSSNGLTLDLQGRLILTQMAKRRVARQEPDGTITPLASTYNGKKFNSPNDVVVKSDGSIFFTDPDFNIPANQSSELKFQGIYRINISGLITLLDNTLNKPNGICFSLDEKKLYVDESAKDSIYVWDVINGDSIANKRGFFAIPMSGYADGMKVDTAGNIYCTGPAGVWIVSPAGVSLGKIIVPGSPSNCAWGDADRKTLYITGGYSLYRIRLATTTGVKDQDPLPSKTFKLLNNYPNPFNPTTMINFTFAKSSHVKLTVYNVLGQQVATLLNEHRSAGEQSVVFDASKLSSGVYFYRLDAGNFSSVKKMMFLK